VGDAYGSRLALNPITHIDPLSSRSKPDTRPAVAPELIGVRVWGPNCIGRHGLASDIEATVDNFLRRRGGQSDLSVCGKRGNKARLSCRR